MQCQLNDYIMHHMHWKSVVWLLLTIYMHCSHNNLTSCSDLPLPAVLSPRATARILAAFDVALPVATGGLEETLARGTMDTSSEASLYNECQQIWEKKNQLVASRGYIFGINELGIEQLWEQCSRLQLRVLSNFPQCFYNSLVTLDFPKVLSKSPLWYVKFCCGRDFCHFRAVADYI